MYCLLWRHWTAEGLPFFWRHVPVHTGVNPGCIPYPLANFLDGIGSSLQWPADQLFCQGVPETTWKIADVLTISSLSCLEGTEYLLSCCQRLKEIHRLNLERLNLEWDFCPNGLNPEWDKTPNRTFVRMDSTPNGTQPRMDSTPNGLNPEWDWTTNGVNPDWDSTLNDLNLKWTLHRMGLNTEWDST